MKKNKPLIRIFLFLLFLNSCSTIADGLGGAKQRNSDEFLVKKKLFTYHVIYSECKHYPEV